MWIRQAADKTHGFWVSFENLAQDNFSATLEATQVSTCNFSWELYHSSRLNTLHLWPVTLCAPADTFLPGTAHDSIFLINPRPHVAAFSRVVLLYL